MRGRTLLGRRFAGRVQLCRYKPGVARDGFAREPDLDLHGRTFHRAERHSADRSAYLHATDVVR